MSEGDSKPERKVTESPPTSKGYMEQFLKRRINLTKNPEVQDFLHATDQLTKNNQLKIAQEVYQAEIDSSSFNARELLSNIPLDHIRIPLYQFGLDGNHISNLGTSETLFDRLQRLKANETYESLTSTLEGALKAFELAKGTHERARDNQGQSDLQIVFDGQDSYIIPVGGDNSNVSDQSSVIFQQEIRKATYLAKCIEAQVNETREGSLKYEFKIEKSSMFQSDYTIWKKQGYSSDIAHKLAKRNTEWWITQTEINKYYKLHQSIMKDFKANSPKGDVVANNRQESLSRFLWGAAKAMGEASGKAILENKSEYERRKMVRQSLVNYINENKSNLPMDHASSNDKKSG